MGKLDGKVAFITGAARGQGRSHAIRLAEEGADIVAVDIGEDIDSVFYPLASGIDLEHTGKLVEDTGQRILARTVDVRDQAALDAAVTDALAAFGHIDIVSANAGIATAMLKTWELSERDWQDVIDVNLTGVWRTVKAVVPAMIEAGRGGCIVLTSSLAGLKGYSNIAGYVAAKHGVNGLMRTLANELGPYNIRVNTVCPGLIHTDMMMNQATYDVFRPDLEGPTKDDATEVFRTMQVLPTDWLDPSDVSEVIVWLASDAARFITGVALPVDAGQIGRG
jgi:SDR family mycofactocin-dependent oxidoreductase